MPIIGAIIQSVKIVIINGLHIKNLRAVLEFTSDSEVMSLNSSNAGDFLINQDILWG